MDRLLDKMDTIILKQRYQISLQEKQGEQQMLNHKAQMKALTRLEENQEMQLRYDAMIESNTRTAAFYSSLTYWNTIL